MDTGRSRRSQTVLYQVGHSLYVNLTNKCPCACTFCIRRNADHVYEETESLWLNHEPDLTEVKAAFAHWDMTKFQELVFCGYGEPTEALDLLLQTARYAKEQFGIRTRINTNGLGNLINGRQIEKELLDAIDTVSISLNTSDSEQYNSIVRPRFGRQSWQAMVNFAKNCVAAGLEVVMTTVSTTISAEDEAACAELCRTIGARYRIRTYSSAPGDRNVPEQLSENTVGGHDADIQRAC